MLQEYSVNFEHTTDADACHRFCGKLKNCNWWFWEPELSLCVEFSNCTESGYPVVSSCENCISSQKRLVSQIHHGYDNICIINIFI